MPVPGGVRSDTGDVLCWGADLRHGDEIPLEREEHIVVLLVIRLTLELEIEVELITQAVHEDFAVPSKDPIRHIGHEQNAGFSTMNPGRTGFGGLDELGL